MLKNALDKEFGILGNTNPLWWDWYRPVRQLGKPEYQNWFKPETLKRMATDGAQQMVEDLYPLFGQQSSPVRSTLTARSNKHRLAHLGPCSSIVEVWGIR